MEPIPKLFCLMKIPSFTVPATILLVLFAACENESRPRTRTGAESAATTGGNQFGYQTTPGTANDFVTDETTPPPMATPTPEPTPDAVVSAVPTPQPTPVAAPTRELPYGTPVPGKQGFVTSPHAPYAGYVDVRGFPPNTEVKDPYSGKIFLVP